MSNDPASNLNLPELSPGAEPPSGAGGGGEDKTASDLSPVFDVPVHIQAVLGRTTLEVSQMLQLAPGSVLELDRRIGEAIDIYVNNRLVARGEIVVVDDRLGVTMTEIVKSNDAA